MTRLWRLLFGCVVLAGCIGVYPTPDPPAGTYRVQDFDVRWGGTVERIKGAAVSNEFFTGGKVFPVLGRAVLPEENGSMRVAVISYRLWNSKFHADPNVIGRMLQVNGQNVTIVGIMAKDFAFPDGAQLWVPSTLR